MNRSLKIIIATVLILSFFLSNSEILYAAAANLSFEKKVWNLPQESVDKIGIVIDPGGNSVIGVDILITYDPKYIEIVDIEDLGIFSGKTGQVIDNQIGSVRFAFSNSYQVYLNKKSTFANLMIKGKQSVNKTGINFVYSKGDTKDTNIVISQGRDVLDSVENIEINIKKANTGKEARSEVENNTNQIDAKYDTIAENGLADTEDVLGITDQNQKSDNDLAKRKYYLLIIILVQITIISSLILFNHFSKKKQ